jgi:hypothetical protein
MSSLKTAGGVEDEFGFLPRFACTTTGNVHRRLVDAVAEAGTVTIDYPALNVFLRTGLYLNGSTPFNEVRRLSPEPVLVAEQPIARDQAMSTYVELFRRAVARRVRPDAVIALSGGRDSRHILLELHAQKAPPRLAVTVAIPGRPAEVDIARELAKRAGVEHQVVAPEARNAIADEEWKNLHTDFLAIEHRWFACAARALSAPPAWWDGIAGDVLSAGLFLDRWSLDLFRAGRLRELAEKLCYEPPSGLWPQAQLPRVQAVAAIVAELAKYRDAANPVGSFYFWNRTRVTIGASAFGMLGAGGREVLAPYLDRDLWKFLSSLPVDLLIDKQFHTDTIRAAYPSFRDVPFYEGGGPPPYAMQGQMGRRLLGFIARRPGFWKPAPLAILMRAILLKERRGEIEDLLCAGVYAAQVQSIRSGI